MFKTILVAILLCLGIQAGAKVRVSNYDTSLQIAPQTIVAATQADMDSMMANNALLKADKPVMRESHMLFQNDSFDFYIILVLILLLGIQRFANPRYFQYLARAMRTTTSANTQVRDQVDKSAFPNLLMNLFFALSGGVYMYYLFKVAFPKMYSVYSPSVLLLVFVAGVACLYGGKYLVMKFSGWAFNVRVIIGHYMYNVFLINKVIAVILLPFIILIAFTQPEIAKPAMILSFFAIGILFAARYVRSWQVLGSFFQYSKFHFFAYLCASELLPMALLTKLLMNGMFY